MLRLLLEVNSMKRFAILILVLALLCGVLTGCGLGKGNVSDRKDGMVTDSPNDADDIIDRNDDSDTTDNGRNDGMKDKNKDQNTDKGRENANDGNKDNPVTNSMPAQSPDMTQPVTP